MSLKRKIAMLGASLRLGRTWADKLELLRLFAKHGGLMAYAGDHEFKTIGTSFTGAPRLHFRDSGPDGILIAELLVEEDYRALRELDLHPRVILDIGANIGLGSFFMKTLYPEARIIGFVPSEAEGVVLSRNYASWKDCELLPVAVGDQDGVDLRFAVHPDKTGGQHLAAGEEEAGWNYVSVPMRRIDALVDEGRVPLPDLVKIDVEGAEVLVLKGFGRHISEPSCYVMETHSESLHAECLNLLRKEGYTVTSDLPRGEGARILCMVKR
ncbi:MAG: methyltransferase FkbM family [Verrucomicrobiaceae bacterium]|nr:methyltransferase FkbM family [Verrucomicrobiaceae bacterium]